MGSSYSVVRRLAALAASLACLACCGVGAVLLRHAALQDRPDWHLALQVLLVLLPAIGLVFAAMSFAGARLVARPLARIAEQMTGGRGPAAASERQDGVATELQPLAIAIGHQALAIQVETAVRSRLSLLAGIAHDLRAPLSRLSLRVEIECQPTLAEAMQADLDAMGRIIGQFTTYARSGGDLALGEPVSLLQPLQHVQRLYRREDVRVEFDRDAAATVSYPEVSVLRVLTNLVDNALAYGRTPVTLSARVDGEGCTLIVRDAGAGIPADSLAQALLPLVRLHPDGQAAGHCGLGLSIVSQICAQLGGRLVHQPFDGTGSAIGVRLPVAGKASAAAD